MIGRPAPSPRGPDRGKPFYNRTDLRLEQSLTGPALVGILNGAPVRIERSPDDPARWRLTLEIQSAHAKARPTNRPRRA